MCVSEVCDWLQNMKMVKWIKKSLFKYLRVHWSTPIQLVQLYIFYVKYRCILI